MATTTLPLSTKDMKDTKIRYGNAVLITYPETSPFAGTYHAYAVKTWKHKTKVLWSDAGLYQNIQPQSSPINLYARILAYLISIQGK